MVQNDDLFTSKIQESDINGKMGKDQTNLVPMQYEAAHTRTSAYNLPVLNKRLYGGTAPSISLEFPKSLLSQVPDPLKLKLREREVPLLLECRPVSNRLRAACPFIALAMMVDLL